MGIFKTSAIVAAALTVAVTAPAQAETSLTWTGSSGVFSHDNITTPTFNDTFTFSLPSMGSAGATISSIASSLRASNNVNFTKVTFNDVNFDIISTGLVEFRSISDLPVVGGLQTLFISGTSAGAGSYSGTLAFEAAVPEPATWAMMIGGFGLVGGMMRRRARNVSVSYA